MTSSLSGCGSAQVRHGVQDEEKDTHLDTDTSVGHAELQEHRVFAVLILAVSDQLAATRDAALRRKLDCIADQIGNYLSLERDMSAQISAGRGLLDIPDATSRDHQ